MNKTTYLRIFFVTFGALLCASTNAQEAISIEKLTGPGKEKPILVSLSGFSGEAVQVLQFDLYVQGFAFTNSEAAQYLITGSNNGNFQGRAIDRFNGKVLVAKGYSGASIRRQ